MPPVTGKFQADFLSFYDAVEKAQVSLRSFEGDSAKVEKQINRMADSLSGRHTIQQATLMSEAIREIGGVSKLSTDEAARALRTLDQAMDKMLRTGEEIPTSMMKQAAQLRDVARASDAADASVHRITGTYRQFDGILQSLGINIGPYIKGLEDIATLAPKLTSGLGLAGGAIAAVATAMAAWKVGSHIGELYGLHNEIARGIAVMRGYGDVQQETVLAQMDAIDLAGQAEANWKRQADVVAEATRAAKAQTEEQQRSFIVTETNTDHFRQLTRQLEELQLARQEDAKAAFAASQAESIFGEATDDTTAKVERQIDVLDRHAQHLNDVAAEAENARAEIAAFMNAPTPNDREAASTAFTLPSLTQRDMLTIQREFDLAGAITGRDPTSALRQKLQQLEAKQGTYQITNNDQFFQMQRDQALLAQLRQFFSGAPGFAMGVENFSGGLARVHRDEVLVNMPKGTSVIPAGAGMRSGFVLNGNVVINGANSRMDGERAGKAFVQFLKDSGQLLPAGVGA